MSALLLQHESLNQPNPQTTHVRVLHVVNGEHYSGAERVQDLLAARLPEFGFEVGFACVKPGKFPTARTCSTAPLYLTPMSFKFDLRAARRIAQIVREGGYRILHAHTPRSALAARVAAAITGVPMIYHVHSPAARDSTHWLRNCSNHWFERLSLSGVAALITVSQSLRRHTIAQGFSADRVFTVPNGVPLAANTRDESRPGSTWTLGMTALFRPRKGLEVLLRAMALLQSRGMSVRLNAVGPFETPEYQMEIHDLTKLLGIAESVMWTGFTQDVNAELAKMDLFVLPSLFGEGLPMVVLEAMAAGVPVVSTRVEGVPEAIEHRISGMIAEAGDAEDLAGQIADVIRGGVSWSALRRNAMHRHAQEFSDVRMAERLADVYRRIEA